MCVTKEKARETIALARAVEECFVRAAKAGAPCPTDRAIKCAVSAHLDRDITRRQVEYAVRRLRNAGIIETARMGGGYRQVYVSALDLWTGASVGEREYPARRRQVARRDGGSKQTGTPRTCLNCGEVFRSEQPVSRRRICDTCKRSDVFESGGDLAGLYV